MAPALIPPHPNAQEWLRQVLEKRPANGEFRQARSQLEAVVGVPEARAFLEACFDEMYKANGEAQKLKPKDVYKLATGRKWQSSVAGLVEHELALITGRIALRAEFFAKASLGQLAVRGNLLRPESEYYGPTAGLSGIEVERDKAAQWITKLSPNRATHSNWARAVLRTHALHPNPRPSPPHGIEDGRGVTPATFGSVDYLRQLIVIIGGDDGHRMQHVVSLGSKYPSSWGGLHLVEQLYATTNIPAQQLPSLQYWTNWAMFFGGMVGAAQPFRDGNKRLFHTLYAAIVLYGTGRFVAPTLDFENSLLKMT